MEDIDDGFHVDVVICLDTTAAMNAPIYELKAGATELYGKLKGLIEDDCGTLKELRVRIVEFKDLGFDGDRALTESVFFSLPEEVENMTAFLDNITPGGGGDMPESALEALAVALKSDWHTGWYHYRQIVVMISNAPALPLGARRDSPYYPSGMPESFEELTDWWENGRDHGLTFGQHSKRFIAFVPDEEPWRRMQEWSRSIFFNVPLCSSVDELTVGSLAEVLRAVL